MPSMEGGGVEKNLIIIANYISKHIKNIKLITFDNTFNKHFDKKIKVINVTKKNQKRYSKYFKYVCCIWLLLKEYLSDKNLLVFTFQANIYVIVLGYFLKFKIISRSNSSPSGWSKSIYKNLIFKFFFKKANSIILNSFELKKEFKKKFFINTNMIYNPLNKKEILKKSNLIKKNYNQFLETKCLKIVNIGRLTDQKDHLTLIKSLNLIVKKINFRMLIIGYGTNKEFLEKKIKFYNLNKFIKIIDNRHNPFPYLKKSDLFILSSKYEGLPNVILEAQTLKKYVISSNCPTGPKEILKNGKNGSLFKVGDYKHLADIILDFNKNKKKYKKITDKAYEDLDRFDYKENCKKYLAIVDKHI